MNLYNINARESFVDVLAGYFLNEYQNRPEELSKILFLLPNRRACQNLAEAFVRHRGMKPTILPKMMPVADAQEDEIFLTGNKEILQKLKPTIDNMKRVLIFTQMIMKGSDYGIDKVTLAQAYSLAENLSNFINSVQNEELDFSKLKEIVPDDYSEHWQKTLKLLEIITDAWPKILEENDFCDPVERKKALLKAELEYWQTAADRPKIVVAGSTAAFPFLKELVKTVAEFDNGEVYLYGLDKYSDNRYWQSIDENHPQYELKELLDYLHLERSEVKDLHTCAPDLREKLVAEIMRPAAVSGAWRNLSSADFPKETFDNIKLINCDDVRQEAKAIAMIMRETLETKDETVALVTSDRNLSRRVISELKKWKIDADDSAGQPLSLTHIGIYFRLIGEAAAQDSMAAKIALMKYPFCACGKNRSAFLKQVYNLEKTLRKEYELSLEQEQLLNDFCDRLLPLKKLYEQGEVNFKEMLTTHIEAAQNLADTDSKRGEQIIWKNDDGQACAKFVADFINKVDILEKIAAKDYLPFLVSVMTKQNVRQRYGYHPRIKILGAIEARLNCYNRVIIGEVNEGVWPAYPKADMWLSRPMKAAFGMQPAERNVGVCASDFAHLMNAPQVYLTRAQKTDGTPTDKSRWWLRFETILGAIYGSAEEDKKKYEFIYNQPYSYWAKSLERCDNPTPIQAPQPRPEVKYRPRELAATYIEKLMHDPYSVYAEKILHLKPLKPLDRKKENYDFGTIVHEVLKEFNDKYDKDFYPDNAERLLFEAGRQKFIEKNIEENVLTFWLPSLKKMIELVVKQEKECRQFVKKIHNEISGQMVIKGTAGDFVITAKADRIDETKDDCLNVIDYKTGKGHSKSKVTDCITPQLPIEAAIAESGGFDGVAAKKVATMSYWSLKNEPMSTNFEESQASVTKIKEVLQTLVNEFDRKERPYLFKPVSEKSGQYGDYDHLARFLEWSTKSNEENGGGDND